MYMCWCGVGNFTYVQCLWEQKRALALLELELQVESSDMTLGTEPDPKYS